mmetsp:Transcript_7490/g.20440  ORF Transcript_7490/g.20440 Transcript_7490/m.20440 type:complete len:226 (+) Transcript_7490:1935-2612(+)
MVEVSNLLEHVVPHLPPQQCPRRRQNDQLPEDVREVDDARLAPFVEIRLGLFNKLRHVFLQLGRAKGLAYDAKLLRTHLDVHVVDHPFAECRHIKVVHLRLRHLVVVRIEKMGRHRWPKQERHLLVQQGHRDHLAVLGINFLHQFPRPTAELQQTADQRDALRNGRLSTCKGIRDESQEDEGRQERQHARRHQREWCRGKARCQRLEPARHARRRDACQNHRGSW